MDDVIKEIELADIKSIIITIRNTVYEETPCLEISAKYRYSDEHLLCISRLLFLHHFNHYYPKNLVAQIVRDQVDEISKKVLELEEKRIEELAVIKRSFLSAQ